MKEVPFIRAGDQVRFKVAGFEGVGLWIDHESTDIDLVLVPADADGVVEEVETAGNADEFEARINTHWFRNGQRWATTVYCDVTALTEDDGTRLMVRIS